MKIPLLDLHAQNRPLREDILDALERVVDSQQFILGPEVAALEVELADALGVQHAVGVSSGTDALLLALMTVGIKPGDEVVTSTYSFFATAGAIVRLGARPVLVDIDPVTFNMNPDAVQAAITPRTRAILPVHLFGLSADLDPICAAAERAGIPVIEDAAQAIGATYKARSTGGIGAIGCFSFYPSKNLGACGDAGLLTTNDSGLAARARLLRTHGMERRYYHEMIGGNFRMDGIQAAVLRVKLPYLDTWTQGRRRNAERYGELFRHAGIADIVTLPTEPAGSRHIFNQYVIRTPHRDALKRHLDEQAIGNEIYYPVPFHHQRCFADLGYKHGDFPEAERAAKETLAIPIYAELAAEQQQTVVDEIARCLTPLSEPQHQVMIHSSGLDPSGRVTGQHRQSAELTRQV
jgi:dTDP-4-amino-4,6-dideoxygalactose transaminase